nr:hypothetical protein [Tanacetum cinerariifolium]
VHLCDRLDSWSWSLDDDGIFSVHVTRIHLDSCMLPLLTPCTRWWKILPRKPCLACSMVFVGDIYEDHVVSCVGIIGIKHRHNVVRDTLVDICFRSGISAGKEVDIGLDERGVDLTGTSPLTQTGMADFILGRAVIDVAHRKRGKYMTKCAAIGYEFLAFYLSSVGELEADAVSLVKRIQKFSVAQDIRARAVMPIFSRISFATAKGVRPI